MKVEGTRESGRTNLQAAISGFEQLLDTLEGLTELTVKQTKP